MWEMAPGVSRQSLSDTRWKSARDHTWIEAKERLSRTARAPKGFVQDAAVQLENACALTTNNRAAAALAHHAGKFYARLRRYDDADRCFDLALTQDSAYPEVLLAKARAARNTGNVALGAPLIERLLEERHRNGISAGLSAYGELVNYPNLLKKWVVDDLDGFVAFVGSAKVDGFSHPDQTIRAVCRGLEYSAPELVVKLLRASDLPILDELLNETGKERTGWAEHYLLYASCLQKTGEAFEEPARIGCTLYESSAELDLFSRARFAKCLLLVGRAGGVVELVVESDDLFCRFYLAQAHFALGDLRAAEEVVNDVIEQSQAKADRYTWDFYRWQGRILEQAGQHSRALASFGSALAKCPPDAVQEIADIKRSISVLERAREADHCGKFPNSP
jgi:tetratricopeptide (TPR) repeat protein